MATDRAIVLQPDTEDDAHPDAGPYPRSETDVVRSDTDVQPLVIPIPAFGPDDFPLASGQIVTCFFDGCECKYKSYVALRGHIMQKHPGFMKVPIEWRDTPFIRFVNLEKTASQVQRRTAKAKAGAAKKDAQFKDAVVRGGTSGAQQCDGAVSISKPASTIGGSSNDKVIDTPGGSAPLVIPESALSELVAYGSLQVTPSGHFQWTHDSVLYYSRVTRVPLCIVSHGTDVERLRTMCQKNVSTQRVNNMCQQHVSTICVSNMCQHNVSTTCVSKLCQQHVSAKCVNTTCQQHVSATCVNNMCQQNVSTQRVNNMCQQNVSTQRANNMCQQNVSTTCVTDGVWLRAASGYKQRLVADGVWLRTAFGCGRRLVTDDVWLRTTHVCTTHVCIQSYICTALQLLIMNIGKHVKNARREQCKNA